MERKSPSLDAPSMDYLVVEPSGKGSVPTRPVEGLLKVGGRAVGDLTDAVFMLFFLQSVIVATFIRVFVA